MSIVIDIADDEVCPEIELAAEEWHGCNRYTLMMPGVELVVSHEQLESMWKQLRPWFEEDA